MAPTTHASDAPGRSGPEAPGPGARIGPGPRLVWAALCLAAIAGLCVLRARVHGDTTLLDVLGDPGRYAGVSVDLATEAVVTEVTDEGFTLRELDREILVRGHLEPDDVGRFVHVRGVFHPELEGQPAWVEPLGVRVHRGRRWKIWLSLAPLAWVGLLGLFTFRARPSRLAFEPRRPRA